MKLILTVFVSALMLSASDPQTAKKKTVAPAKVVKPLEIPKEAVETEPGTFRYTDSGGKKWIYRKTPWGVARAEDTGEDRSAAKHAVAGDGVNAIEARVMVRFRLPGPFSISNWTSD